MSARRLDFGFCPPRLLEVADIELFIAAGPRERLGWSCVVARRIGNAQQANGSEDVRSQERRVRRDHRAPVVADDGGGVRAKAADDLHIVGNVGEHPVGSDIERLDGSAIPAHVDRRRPKSSLSQCRKLMAPGEPELREPMNQQDQRSLSVLDDVNATPRNTDQRVFHSAPRR